MCVFKGGIVHAGEKRSSFGSAHLLRYTREDTGSTFIIDLPQLQKYPNKDTLLSACACTQACKVEEVQS